jgi:hypothetical protein
MVDIRKEFPRKYMSAIDLEGDARLFAQIASAEMTTFKTGDPALMLTLRHNGAAPKLVRCNQTNRQILATAFGWDTDAWINKKIELSVEPTSMGPGIRMRPITDGKTAAPPAWDPPPKSKPQKSQIEDDEIPW